MSEKQITNWANKSAKQPCYGSTIPPTPLKKLINFWNGINPQSRRNKTGTQTGACSYLSSIPMIHQLTHAPTQLKIKTKKLKRTFSPVKLTYNFSLWSVSSTPRVIRPVCLFSFHGISARTFPAKRDVEGYSVFVCLFVCLSVEYVYVRSVTNYNNLSSLSPVYCSTLCLMKLGTVGGPSYGMGKRNGEQELGKGMFGRGTRKGAILYHKLRSPTLVWV